MIRISRAHILALVIPSKADDSSLCLACHAGKGPFAALQVRDVFDSTRNTSKARELIKKTVEAHTHHPYVPEGPLGLSRCTGCHMVAGHGFDVVPPAMTLKFATTGGGVINSCAAACHSNKVDVWGYGLKGGPGLSPSICGTNVTTWANPVDVTLANKLKEYFGDNGIWWKTAK